MEDVLHDKLHKPVDQLLKKEMDRRQFLAHIGAGALTIMGVSGLIKGLVNYSGRSSHHLSSGSGGYGGSSYGGKKH